MITAHSVFSTPEMCKNQNGPAPPREFFDVFVWFHLFMGILLFIGCVANILSGVFLWRRRHRLFSLVVAGLNCLQIPFGTALGVFTLSILMRDSVRPSYVT